MEFTKSNSISSTSIMTTLANIVSYIACAEREGQDLTEEQFSFKAQFENFVGFLATSEFNYTNLSAEDLRTFGAMCDTRNDLFILPPWFVDICPQDTEFFEVDKSGGAIEIKGKKKRSEINVWNEDIDSFGLTNYGIHPVPSDAYDIVTDLKFIEAFDIITKPENAGKKIMRLPQWSEDVFIACQWPDKNSKMTHPYLYVTSRFGCVPWQNTVPELFSVQWQVFDKAKYDEIIAERDAKRKEMQEKMQSGDVQQIAQELINGLKEKTEGENKDEEVTE